MLYSVYSAILFPVRSFLSGFVSTFLSKVLLTILFYLFPIVLEIIFPNHTFVKRKIFWVFLLIELEFTPNLLIFSVFYANMIEITFNHLELYWNSIRPHVTYLNDYASDYVYDIFDYVYVPIRLTTLHSFLVKII